MSNLKVLIVSINSQYVHSSPVPFILKAACEASTAPQGIDYEFETAEFTINEQPDFITSQIVLAKPHVLAFSCYIWNFEMVKKVVADIKKIIPDCRIVLGGPEAEYSAKPLHCESVLYGDGEASLPVFLGMKPVSADPFQNAPNVHETIAATICKAGTNRIVYLETTRGCPYKCIYCLAPQTGSLRKLEMSLVKKLIDIYMRSQVRQVKFVDRTFNCDRKRSLEIIEYIAEAFARESAHGLCPPNSWHFEVAADLFDEQTLSLVERLPAGLVQFETGVQSLNSAVLEQSARKTDTHRVLQNITRLVNSGTCLVHADLIAGLPGEDLESFIKGFDRLHACFPHQLQLGFLKNLKGSALAERADELGMVFSENAPFGILRTPSISWAQLHELSQVEDMVERCWNNGRFVDTVRLLAAGKFFDFYANLSTQTRKLENPQMSAATMAQELYKLAKCLKVDVELARRTILIDLITSCFPVKVPEVLRTNVPLKAHRAKISEFAKANFGDVRIHIEPLTEDGVLILNCDLKSQVSGRFEYVVMNLSTLA